VVKERERERDAKKPPITYKWSGPCKSFSAHIIHKAIKYVSVVSQAHCRLCFMRVVLNSAAGHHKLALLSVCQTLSLCCFNILSLPLSLDVSLLFLFVALFLVRGSNFIYHLLCPVANIGSKNTLTCSKTRNIIFSCNHRFTGAQNERF